MKRPAVAESKTGNQCRDRTPLARRSCSRETERLKLRALEEV
jgi:hypothetical protein